MTLLISVLAFLVAITILVAFHEWGHFYVARRCGVKVTRFSIGFGKRLFGFRDKKGTDFRVSLIPLGGYIKMLDSRYDSVSESEGASAFDLQPVWKRMAIVVAGPLANFILAAVFFWGVFMVGTQTTLPLVATVQPNSIAAKGGVQPGTIITAVDGQSVYSWSDVHQVLLKHAGKPATASFTTRPRFGEGTSRHTLSLQDKPFTAANFEFLPHLGITPFTPIVPLFMGKVNLDSPASKAGLRAGDRVVALNGEKIPTWQAFVKAIQDKPGEKVTLTIEREGEPQDLTLTPSTKTTPDGKKTYGSIGVWSRPVTWPKDLKHWVRFGPLVSLSKAAAKTWDMTRFSVVMMAKIFQGQVTWKAVSGPIGIAQVAGQTATFGLVYYLGFLAIVSINLGILNLLPIPILDGGNLLYYLVEVVTGKPLSERAQLLGFKVGLTMLLALMIVAFYNDLSRILHF